MLDPLLKISLTDAVDILFVSLLIWAIIAWMRHVRANLALLGLGIIGLFYLVALQLELQLTAWIFQSFFAVLVVLLVVVFQDDLRRLFERIAVLGLRRRRLGRRSRQTRHEAVGPRVVRASRWLLVR